MSNNILLSLNLLIFSRYFLNAFCSLSRNKQKNNILYDNSNNIFKKSNTIKNERRKLQDDDFPLVNLSIYIDTAEFNATIPDDLLSYKNTFIKAMNKAKKILENLLEKRADVDTPGIDLIINQDGKLVSYVEFQYNITNYTDLFREEFLKFDEYNQYIFAKFTRELKEESASVILDENDDIPIVGIVLFNENIDKNKLSFHYLTTLMLHHFIRLLGFSENENDFNDYIASVEDTGLYYLSIDEKYNFTNVINYARKYFNCPSINRIDLFLDEENVDEDNYYYEYAGNTIIGLYWPKRLLIYM